MLYTDSEGNNLKIMPQAEPSAAEDVGYLYVDGHYMGTYDLRERKDAEAARNQNIVGTGNPGGLPH